MRVSIIGQAAFGQAVLERLAADGHEIVGVSAPGPAGSREDPLWAAAVASGLQPIPTADLRQPEGLAAWRGCAGDVCVMAFVTHILPQDLFAFPREGTIQYHPSLLPLHRGSSAINWAIINGDNRTGLTVFWPDRGIDTGPILLQRTFAIGPTDTVGSLYFQHLFPSGVDAMSEAVRLIEGGRAPRIDQDHAAATYEPPCGEEHAQIPWHAPADRLFALIRGCNPQPGAWTTYAGARLRIFDSVLADTPEPGMPGRVLRIDEDGFDVRLNGGVLRVLRVQPDGAKKIGAGEWAAAVGLEPGARFR